MHISAIFYIVYAHYMQARTYIFVHICMFVCVNVRA